MSTSSSNTRPLAGRSSPASTRSNVVLPEPFGPRMPTNPFAGTPMVTPRRTAADPYEKKTSAACSNPQSCHEAAGERGEPVHLLVRPVEQVFDSSEQLELARQVCGDSGIPHRVAGRIEQPAKRSE